MEDRRIEGQTPERMGRAQDPPQAGAGLPGVGEVVPPAMRPIRSVTPRSAEDRRIEG